MNEELILTQNDIDNQFHGEFDAVTHMPYAVGDKIKRCSQCRAIIKSEFTLEGCPLCGVSPFRASQVQLPAIVRNPPHLYNRDEMVISIIGPICSMFSLLPFLFPSAQQFISEALFNVRGDIACVIVASIALISSVIMLFIKPIINFWSNKRFGPLVLGIPAIIPYILIATVWAVFVIGAVIIGIAIIILCFAILAGVFYLFDS